MRTIQIAFTTCILICTATFVSCNSSAEKVENAERNVVEANKKLETANKDYLVDMENYKKEAVARIEANQKAIDEFNARILDEKKEARADYNKRIVELNAKNSDLKKKLEDYKADGKENWEAFKIELSQDMDSLGEAIKDFFD